MSQTDNTNQPVEDVAVETQAENAASTTATCEQGSEDQVAAEERQGAERRGAPERRGSAERRGSGERRAGVDRRSGVDRRNGLDRRRGPGRRRGEVRRAAEEGEIDGELLEFVMAVDEYKRVNQRPYPTISEIFEIVHYLGYRKVADRAEHVNVRSGDVGGN